MAGWSMAATRPSYQAQDQRHMVLALKKFTAQASFTLTFSSTMGLWQDHLPPWRFIPCAYEVSITPHLPKTPQERIGSRGFSIQGSTTQKAAKTVHSREQRLLYPSLLPQRSLSTWFTESLTKLSRLLARGSELSSGLGSRRCQAHLAFWKSQPEDSVKGPVCGAQGVEAHAPEGRPLVERLACAPLSNARVSGGASASKLPT